MFRADQFLTANLQLREESVDVPELAAFFDGPPTWRVRGLTGAEFANADLAAEHYDGMAKMAEALSGGPIKAMAEAAKQLLGMTEETPPVVAKRLRMLALGSVDPKCDEEMAVRLCEKYPMSFYRLTTKIQVLTGMGAEEALKKPEPSTETPASS